MKKLVTIILLTISLKSFSQDSIKVKIIKVTGYQVVMKTMERPRVKLMTFCKCPYKRKEIVWIKKP